MSWFCRASANCVNDPKIFDRCEYFANHDLTQFNPKNGFRWDATAMERYKVCEKIIRQLDEHITQATQALNQWMFHHDSWDDCDVPMRDVDAKAEETASKTCIDNRILCTRAAIEKLREYQQQLLDQHPSIRYVFSYLT